MQIKRKITINNNIYIIYLVLSAIEEVTSADICFIGRKEINEFINRFNVDFKINDDFKLSDHYTWKL